MAKKAIVFLTVLWLKDGIGVNYDHRPGTTSKVEEEKAKELAAKGWVTIIQEPATPAKTKAEKEAEAAKKAQEDADAAAKQAEADAAQKAAEAAAGTTTTTE